MVLVPSVSVVLPLAILTTGVVPVEHWYVTLVVPDTAPVTFEGSMEPKGIAVMVAACELAGRRYCGGYLTVVLLPAAAKPAVKIKTAAAITFRTA
jgi:hypothetical protein